MEWCSYPLGYEDKCCFSKTYLYSSFFCSASYFPVLSLSICYKSARAFFSKHFPALKLFQTDETCIHHGENVLHHVFLLSYFKYLPFMLQKLISIPRNFSSSTVFINPGRFFSSQFINRH